MDKFKQTRQKKQQKNSDTNLKSLVIEKVIFERVYRKANSVIHDFINGNNKGIELLAVFMMINKELSKQSKLFDENLNAEIDKLYLGAEVLVNVWQYQDRLQFDIPLDPRRYKTFEDFIMAFIDIHELEKTLLSIGAKYH